MGVGSFLFRRVVHRLWDVVGAEIIGHVGLTAAEPRFADNDILDRLRLRARRDLDLSNCARGEGRKFERPLSILAGARIRLDKRLALGIEEFRLDHRAGRRPAPDGIVLTFLQHHMIADDGGKFQGGRWRRIGERGRMYGHQKKAGGEGKTGVESPAESCLSRRKSQRLYTRKSLWSFSTPRAFR